MLQRQRILWSTLALLSFGSARLAFANEPNGSLQPPYPVYRVDARGQPLQNSRPHAIAIHALTAPLTLGFTGLAYLFDEPTKFSGLANGGLQFDYQYRFGIASLGAGLRWRMLYNESGDSYHQFPLHDVTVPFIASFMSSNERGPQFGVSFDLGPGVATMYSSELNYSGIGSNVYTPRKWHGGWLISASVLFNAIIPLSQTLDLSLRGGVELAYGSVYRISTPIQLGIRKRF